MAFLFPKEELPEIILEWNTADASFINACKEKGYFPFFRYIDWALKNKIADKRITFILRHNINLWHGHPIHTLETTGAEFGITRERVRQIYERLQRQVKGLAINSAQVIGKHLIEQNYFKHELWNNNCVTSAISDSLNKQEETAFTAKAHFLMFEILSNNSMLQFSFTHNGTVHNFMINPNVMEEVKLAPFMYQIRHHKYYDIEKAILNNLRVKGRPVSEQTVSSLKILTLQFKENKKKQFLSQPDMAYHALKTINKPSIAEDIAETINKLYPETKHKNYKWLHMRLLLDKKRFIVSDPSTGLIALKEWENNMPGIKGGKIADIAVDFLQNNNNPAPITAVVKHILKFRKTYYKSILENLRLDKKKRFIFPEKGLVSLSK